MTRAHLALFLLASSAAAQVNAGSNSLGVRFTYANGFCYPFTVARLVGVNGPIAERTPDENCVVDFAGIPAGTYHVKASGQNLTYTDSIIATSPWTADILVQVKDSDERAQQNQARANALVSAADLRVPEKAQKEFAKANEFLSRNDYAKAIQRLRRAIQIYPAFAAAYNNLGVIYQRLGDPVQERDALRKAVGLNDHFALAYLNLGRMAIRNRDFNGAEAPLTKASTLAPSDPEPLLLLAYSQLMNRRFEDAIASSQKAHSLGGAHAFVHRIAARAFEQQERAASAIAELEVCLREESDGSLSVEVGNELDMVRRGVSILAELDITDLAR
ncbi:MAG TPA: tetratricopeptide repeat protein [Candidatus Sulfotelmatobacter sp.]|jgi:Flp pilus assembly protein TadD|nr:tetratricopeptide repeat protein [Candidatus Sulfotelmatobacter sp.]